MRKFSKCKAVNEVRKEPYSAEALEMKSVLTPSLPIEQVIYLNEGDHIKGSNRYTFNYSEQLGTVTSRSHIFSIRAVHVLGDGDNEYILAASFASQTKHNYLGLTNTQFNPPKQYMIQSYEHQYWIDVFSSDARTAVELPDDDSVVIILETQLITYTPNKYL